MKKAFVFAGLAAATLSFVGCNKEADFVGRDGDFEVILNNDETRTVNNGMQTAWADNDQLSAFYAPAGSTTWSGNIKFTVKDTESNLATGEVGELAGSAYDWYFLYPYSGYVVSPTGLNAAGDPSGYMTVGSAANGSQRQTGYDSMAHLAGSALPVYGVVKNIPADEQPVVTMHQIASVVKVNVKNATAAPVHITNVAVTAPVDIVGTYYLDITGAAPAFTPSGENYVSKTATLVVADHTDLAVGATASFYLAVKPFTAAAGSELSVSVTASNGEQTSVKSLVAATVFSAGKIKEVNVNYDKAATVSEYEWVKKNLESITAEDVFVIVGNNGADFAMSNDQGTSAPPAAVSVSVQDDKLMLEPAANIQWTLTKSGSGYTFAPKGAETHLYCTNTNNGVRVGTNANSTFTLDQGYLKHEATSRYVGIYNSADWRCYTTNTTNIKDQTFAFYVKYATGTGTPDKVFRAELEGALDGENLEVPASTVSATIHITADADVAWTAEPSEGLTLSAASGTGTATVTASFAANTATTPKAYSVMVRTSTPGVDNDEFELTITQLGVSTTAQAYPYEESFASSQGDFTIDNESISGGLSYVWNHTTYNNNGYMKASAYVNSTNNPCVSWLLSPFVDMARATAPVLSFSHAVNMYFGTVSQEATVWIKEEGGDWNQLTITYPTVAEGKTFSDFETVSIDVSSYAGKKVQVGFKYVSTSEHAGTWEVKNFKLDEPASGPVDPTFTVPETLTVEEGATAKINVTTNTDGTVSFTSANTAVATVAADGTVTGVAAGTTTVTVAAAATANFNAASRTVAVTVTAAQTGSHYGKVSTITSGKKYLIAAGGQAKIFGTLSSGKAPGVDVTIAGGKIASDATTNAYAVTITVDNGGKYSIVLPDGKYLLYGSSTNLKASATATDTWTVGTGVQGVFRFTSTATEERALAYRAGSQNNFGGYAVSNLTATSQEYFDIDLYELGAEPAAPAALSSIAVSGQKTEFYVGDAFVFDGVVTATYEDGTTKDVSNSADLTVTPPDLTTAGTKTVNVSYTESGKSAQTSYTVTVVQKPAGTILEFMFNEKSSTTGTDQWPTEAQTAASQQTYTLNQTDYTFALGKDTYMGMSSGKVYLMVKNGSYLGLPAIEGKKLVKVAYTTSSGASTGTYGAICTDNAGATPVTGGAAIALNEHDTEFTWTLSGTTANTMYYFVASKKNSQAVRIVLTYE